MVKTHLQGKIERVGVVEMGGRSYHDDGVVKGPVEYKTKWKKMKSSIRRLSCFLIKKQPNPKCLFQIWFCF